MRTSDCALLVALPLQRSEFMADHAAGTCFLQQFVARQRSRDVDILWATYEASAAPVRASAERARRHGVSVVTRAVLADLARCLQAFQVVTLVAHAVRTEAVAVEFTDGLAAVESLVDAIPETFDGVLDLTDCNAPMLAAEIQRRCRRGLIIANASPGPLDVRMEFYNAAMDLVQRRQVTYQDAVFGVRQHIRGQP